MSRLESAANTAAKEALVLQKTKRDAKSSDAKIIELFGQKSNGENPVDQASAWWDRDENAGVKGLHRLKGRKTNWTWWLYYRRASDHLQRRLKIGKYPALGLEEARAKARKAWELINAEKDPKIHGEAARIKARILEKNEAGIVRKIGELFEIVWERHWDKPRYIQSGRAKDVRYHWQRSLSSAFANQYAAEISSEDVLQWFTGMASTPFEANRSIEILSFVFKYAINFELIPNRANPCSGVKRNLEPSRKIYPTAEELRKIDAALDAAEIVNPVRVAYIRTVMFTGSRLEILEKVTWDQLTIYENHGEQYGVITFHGKSTAKTGDDEQIIVPPNILKNLEMIREHYPAPNNRIFNCKAPKALWNRIRKKVGAEHLWFRDLRRNYGSLARTSGLSNDSIGALLNHSDPNSTKIYAKLEMAPRIRSAQQAVAQISETLKGP